VTKDCHFNLLGGIEMDKIEVIKDMFISIKTIYTRIKGIETALGCLGNIEIEMDEELDNFEKIIFKLLNVKLVGCHDSFYDLAYEYYRNSITLEELITVLKNTGYMDFITEDK